MDTRYLLREAAAYFHTGGLSGMLRHPVEHRAEMMAHILIKSVRDDYIESQRQAASKKRDRDKSGYNPSDAIHRQWLVSK